MRDVNVIFQSIIIKVFQKKKFYQVFDKATSKSWTRTLKNLDPEKHGKQLDMEKWLEDHILKLINTENLLRRDL